MSQFGTQFASQFAVTSYAGGSWSAGEVRPLQDLSLHPGAHVLHYGSSCFEGLKAYRHDDGRVYVFRLDRHLERLQNSARMMCLPVPEIEHLRAMIAGLIGAVRAEVPEYPSALYLRPVLAGMDANIGKAARPSEDALLFVLASPVGNYFSKGESALRLWVDDRHMRTTPEFGEVKTGGNYAAALNHVVTARKLYGVDQVLFCPDGVVQETAAANFLLLNDEEILTKPADGSILPGVTRASLLELATRAGYRVVERDFGIEEMFRWVKNGEAALSGTAAVLAGVGTLVHESGEHPVNGGEIGPNTRRLREMLKAIHCGSAPDELGWLAEV